MTHLNCLLVAAVLLFAPLSGLASNDAERIAKRDAILAQISGATMPQKTLSITAFGAKGDGKKDCKPAFDKAMKRAARQGGARIVVPAGEYLLNGPIHFVSNVCLELQEGATLKFSPEPRYYLPVVKTSWEGTFLQNYSPFIYGYQLENVSIVGEGTIDGNAATTFSTWKNKQREGQQLTRDMNHNETPVEERNFGEGFYLRPQLSAGPLRCRGEGVYHGLNDGCTDSDFGVNWIGKARITADRLSACPFFCMSIAGENPPKTTSGPLAGELLCSNRDKSQSCKTKNRVKLSFSAVSGAQDNI